MTYQNGDIYEGEWLDDNRHGQGKFFHAKTGKTRVGQWSRDVEVSENDEYRKPTPWVQMRAKK